MSDDEMKALIERQGEVQEKIDHLDAWDIDARLEMAMDALRCPPGDMPVRVLSGGERRRVALCRLLLQKTGYPPAGRATNHLDAETVAWLERHLQEYAGTVIAVTHDRYFLDNVAEWILELDRGQGIPYRGNYSSGWSRNRTACAWKNAPRASASRLWNASWIGSAWRLRRATPNPRRVFKLTNVCWARNLKSWRAIWKSTFPLARAWAKW
jgi:ATPase subunit of ABC transporter with duplicated ATPase domains